MKRIGLALAFVGVAVLGLVGCGTEKTAPAETAKSQHVSFVGSSTLAPVLSKLGANFHEEFKTWDKVKGDLPKTDIVVYVSSGGSGTGVKAMIDKTADFGLVAREVKSTEKEKIKGYKEYKVGIDALGIAVHPNHPLLQVKDNLTKEEIKKLFSGEYTTWNQVDPSLPAEEIVILTRDVGGGAHEVFQKQIMGDVKVKKEAIQAPSMGALVAKIMDNPYAIGYASYGMIEQNKGRIVPLAVEGVPLDRNTILDGRYTIQRPLLIIGHGDEGPMQQAFMGYVKSEAGQRVVESMGFIPVAP